MGSLCASYSYGGCFQANPSGHSPAMAAIAAAYVTTGSNSARSIT